MKKRHWCLGSFMILAGSWITHTTTATIADTPINQQASSHSTALGFAHLNDDNTETNSNNPVSLSNNPISLNVEKTTPATSIMALPKTVAVVKENFKTINHTVKKGESLGIIFKKLGFDLSLPYKISQHETAKELVSLSVGKTLTFKVDKKQTLRHISYPKNALQNFTVSLDNNNINDAGTQDLAYKIQQRTISGEITTSLYEAALDSGMSIATAMEMVKIFGWDIDFVLDIRAGDTFHVIHDFYEMKGEKIADGNILAAEFTTQGNVYRAIRFIDEDGTASYYTPEGDSMLGTFLRSPVEFSRISSRFGKRKHPILKTWRAHKGVDYAASRGTPIRATADGKVIHAGNKGGYGRTVVIRHAGRFSTLYAHMKNYAKGIKNGSRVKQGQIIGYVGSSGLATGPHLHYEFRLDGVHRNPLTYKTPKASSIKEKNRAEFELLANSWVRQLDAVQEDYLIAKAKASSKQI